MNKNSSEGYFVHCVYTFLTQVSNFERSLKTVLHQKLFNLSRREFYLKKLCFPRNPENFTFSFCNKIAYPFETEYEFKENFQYGKRFC